MAPMGATILSPDDGVIPDAARVRPERVHIVNDVEAVGAPDLVVEVLSPGNRGYDLIRKRARYEANGVEELWFVDLEAERIEVLRLGVEGRYGHPRLLGRGRRSPPRPCRAGRPWSTTSSVRRTQPESQRAGHPRCAASLRLRASSRQGPSAVSKSPSGVKPAFSSARHEPTFATYGEAHACVQSG